MGGGRERGGRGRERGGRGVGEGRERDGRGWEKEEGGRNEKSIRDREKEAGKTKAITGESLIVAAHLFNPGILCLQVLVPFQHLRLLWKC